jgi:hypothetical protein
MYTLYFDESGDWGYPRYDPNYPILCLCGVIALDTYYTRKLIPLMKSHKREHFNNEDIVLRRYDVRWGRNEFYSLKKEKDAKEFISQLDIKILIAALDKVDQYRTYGTKKVDEWLPKDIYSLLFTFIVERYTAFLIEHGNPNGKIVAESRGRTEDQRVQFWYSTILQIGTQFYRNWQLQKVLPTAIEFREKKDNIAGLQASDWIANPMAKKVRFPDGCLDEFGEWELYKNAIWLGKNAPARGQVGFKTFPKNLGRKLLNMPLKSS